MIETVVRALADAFMEVGVYVALLLAFFGWLQWRTGERVSELLQRHRRWAPLVGALLGVSPGCAGALLVMPLYVRGVVPFGAVVAALVATMGDSSWVLIAHDPLLALAVHGVLLVTGIVAGYVVHILGIAPPVRPSHAAKNDPDISASPRPFAARSLQPVAARSAQPVARPVLPGGAALAVAGGAVVDLGVAPAAFWLVAAIGVVVSVPVVFQLADPTVWAQALGGVDPYLLVGVLGTLAAMVVFTQSRGKLADDTLESIAPAQAGMAAVLRNGARETSFVITWVAIVYVAYDAVAVGLLGFDATVLAGVGVAGVVIGALVGLVPGCAIQIVFTGLYVAGGLPLPTLLANAVSQDGDALLPLLFTERRAAILATLLTTIPALVVGLAALALLG